MAMRSDKETEKIQLMRFFSMQRSGCSFDDAHADLVRNYKKYKI